MPDKIIKSVIVLLGVFLLLYQLVFYAREATKVVAWSSSGRTNTDIRMIQDDSLYVFTAVDTTDFVRGIYPSIGDTLITAADSSSGLHGIEEAVLRPVPAGTRLDVIFKHDGIENNSSFVYEDRNLSDIISTIALQVLRFLITISYLLVGMWAFFKRPDSAGVRILALFCLSMTSFMMAGVTVMSSRYALFEIPGQTYIVEFLGFVTFCFGAFWLLLQLYFPRPVSILKRWIVLIYLAVFSPQILLLVFILILRRFDLDLPDVFFTIFISIQVFLGFIVLSIRRTRTHFPLEKRQLSLVLYGTGIGLGSLFILIIIAAIPGLFTSMPEWGQLLLINFVFLALLLSPISFAYAFGKYRLLEVEGRLRRGTRYVIVTGVLLVVFFGLLYLISGLLLNTLNVASRTPTLIIALLLALSFAPVHRKVKKIIEQRFFPERMRLRNMLADFLSSTMSMPDRNTLWQRLEENLKEGLGIAVVLPVLSDENSIRFKLPDGKPVPLETDSELILEMEQYGRSIMVDEAIAAEKVNLTNDEKKWLRSNRIALLLPMLVHSRLIGFIALSFETDRENMSAEDLDVLRSLASQVALQNENLRLLEDNFEKKRLEEQLAVAREVQERFLPSILPLTPGIDIAAKCQFSLEVAGDYYDVIPLSGDRTLMAVGDVSGKGAGAAMIMANLQASLRTLSGMDVNLAEVVGRANDVMCQNTDPEQYVTFFAAIYDPGTGEINYVNAGHNPPVIITENEEIIPLTTGGLVLGVLPGISYLSGSMMVSRGDLLLAYTDGVSEAMDDTETEFGEDHIIEIAILHRKDDVGKIIDQIQSAVEKYTNGKPFEDDFTILIARVKD
ncbi:MAG: SpoIIE family protein phosphatase [Candidatus Electryonea clarkiae]|nr:SpoIIE family protein phosphatase [Candidatus Electryonea clarkiae]MDP8285592.1 SpoIIE family protein phosphatase [Candidatus Electryonea clarkiae]